MGLFWLQSCREIIRLFNDQMTGKQSYLTIVILILWVMSGCSTMSRTEKQLAKVDSFESPDIPFPGMLPPERPRNTGLEYSKDVLIISYDAEIGKEPLRKAINKYGAEVIYDYRMVNAMAVRIPDPDKMEEMIARFEKVKGVLQVSRDQIYHLDPPVRPVLEIK